MAAATTSGMSSGRSCCARVPSPPSASYSGDAVAIDDDRRVDRVHRSSPAGSGPQRSQIARRRSGGATGSAPAQRLPPKGGSHSPTRCALRRASATSAHSFRLQAEDHCHDPLHRCTVITAVAVRPKTSGSYISSARAGAVRNVPAVVARDDVGELVAAFGQPRREQLHAVVVALDVIEAAALATTMSQRLRGSPVVLLWRARSIAPWSRTRTRAARSRRAADR